MKSRITLSIVLFSLLFVFRLSAQTLDDDVASPYAVTPEEKEKLLEKAEEALIWFRSLARETRSGIPSAGYRKKIQPMELMQAAAMLKKMDKTDVSRMLREMLPFLQPSSEECFEIVERLGDETLESFLEEKEILTGDTVDAPTRLRQGARRFLRESLTPAEKMALMDGPKSAAELVDAIDLLAVSSKPMLVRYYLRKLLDIETTPEECGKIVRKIGSRRLMQIAGNEHFAPQGEKAISKIFQEAQKHWSDSETVSGALDAWKGPDRSGRISEESKESLHALWRGQRVSSSQLIDRLAETDDDKDADELIAVLLSIGGDVKEALSESLRSDRPTLLRHAARGLDVVASEREAFLFYPILYSTSETVSDELRKQVEQAVVRRLGRKPTLDEAVATLGLRADDYFTKNRALRADPDGYVRFWNWDETEKKPKYIRMLVPAAYRLFAYRYALQAQRIASPESDRYAAVRRRYLTTLFERTGHLNGLDEPLDEKIAALDEVTADLEVPQLERILIESLKNEHFAAARVAVTLLGKRGDAKELLSSGDGRPRPIVQATAAPDRRVRFAAADAIMSLEPDFPYPGSSLIPEALAWFSRADGRRILVSAHPKQSAAAKTAGYFIACGYKGDLAVTGREAMRLAAATPDVEMLVVDLRCSEPSVPDLVQAMRNDNRTHDIPIAVLSDSSTVLDDAERRQSLHTLPTMQKIERSGPDNPFGVSLSQVYARIVSDEGARWVETDLFEKTGAEPVSPEVRLEQARQALDRLKKIQQAVADGGPEIYRIENLDDIISDALRSDVRLISGLELAASVRSSKAQGAIYDIVADVMYPLDIREKAVEAFTQSVKRFGILLRGKQVQRLYDRYNAGETELKETQELLGRVLDLIEDTVFGEEERKDEGGTPP